MTSDVGLGNTVLLYQRQYSESSHGDLGLRTEFREIGYDIQTYVWLALDMPIYPL